MPCAHVPFWGAEKEIIYIGVRLRVCMRHSRMRDCNLCPHPWDVQCIYFGLIGDPSSRIATNKTLGARRCLPQSRPLSSEIDISSKSALLHTTCTA